MAELPDVTQQAIDYSQRIPNNVDLSTTEACNGRSNAGNRRS